MIIRPVGPRDCAVIAALEASLFDSAFQQKHLEHLVRRDTFCGYMIERSEATSGEVSQAGYILSHIVADRAEIISFAVVPQLRRFGYGHALLERFFRDARDRGVSEVALEVASDNEPALAFYRNHGFTSSGVRLAYYKRDDGACDAILMVCWLDKAFA